MGEGDRAIRSRSMDIFKGVAISIIVILHIGIVAKGDVGNPAPPVQALYLGLVGFFIMSGYFFRPGRGFRENMLRRVRILLLALLIAAIGLSVISFLWCYLWGQPTDLDDLLLCMQRALPWSAASWISTTNSRGRYAGSAWATTSCGCCCSPA